MNNQLDTFFVTGGGRFVIEIESYSLNKCLITLDWRDVTTDQKIYMTDEGWEELKGRMDKLLEKARQDESSQE